MFARGLDQRDVEFLELTKTLDISNLGAKVIGHLPLKRGDLISLTIPAPLPSAPEFGGAGTPPIQARLLRVEKVGDLEAVGVEFVRPLE